MMYDYEKEIESSNVIENIYSFCGVDKEGKTLTLISYYTDEGTDEKEIAVDFGKTGEYEVYLLDETHDSELIVTTGELKFTMQPNTCLMIKEK